MKSSFTHNDNVGQNGVAEKIRFGLDTYYLTLTI